MAFGLADDKESIRSKIVDTLVDFLRPLDFVHAFWEGGAAAFGRVDEWSDIDLYVVVDDDKVDQTFIVVEEALKSVSPIDKKYPVLQNPWPGVFQAFYRLRDTSKYVLIDLAILQFSGGEKFLEPEIHGNNVFYFSNPPEIKPALIDADRFNAKMQERLKRLQARFEMFNIFVQKEINRANSLEAIGLYHNITLASLVEALRAKYNPFHFDFRMRYVHYELPEATVNKLQDLYFVRNMDDLQEKYRKASQWFLETMPQVSTTPKRKHKGVPEQNS